MSDLLLDIKNLVVDYATSRGTVRAVDGFSLSVAANEIVGLVGESGCGKTSLIKALLRLLPSTARVAADRLRYKGIDLLSAHSSRFRKEILWKEISFVPQSAMAALNPVYRVGAQLTEAISSHRRVTAPEAKARVLEVFHAVGLQPAMAERFPHEFSGGMRQRAMIAMALVLNPSLIVMDEPTTGLDVLIQDRILDLLRDVQRRTQCSLLLVSHDISVIAQVTNRVAMMYSGSIVEEASTVAVFDAPCHPYTMGLQNAFPSILDVGKELISIPGKVAVRATSSTDCSFNPRCPFALERCRTEFPKGEIVTTGHIVACHRRAEAEELRMRAREKSTWQF